MTKELNKTALLKTLEKEYNQTFEKLDSLDNEIGRLEDYYSDLSHQIKHLLKIKELLNGIITAKNEEAYQIDLNLGNLREAIELLSEKTIDEVIEEAFK